MMRSIPTFSLLRLRAVLLLCLSLFCLVLPAAHALTQDDLLPVEKAFAARVEREGNRLQLTFDVAAGYYLYRDRTHLRTEPAGLIEAPVFPAGKVKNDPFFGQQTIFTGSTRLSVPLKPGAPERFTLLVELQGCAEAGICYPPHTYRLKVGTPAAAGLAEDWLAPAARDAQPERDLNARGWLSTLATFFIAGLGMAFTACMYPLLPIVSSMIAGQGGQLTRRRGLLLAFAYVQGPAFTYTVVGVIAGLTGSLLTVWLQQPAVVLTASALMVVFALGMFDLVSIQLPSALQSRLAASSNRLSGGRFVTVFAMGMFSALIIGPCVAPPLALALGYIGSTGDAWLGGAALYAMAWGLGLPLLLIGAFGGHFLPRAGAWMKAVKAAFGVIMLALALWLASPFLPAPWVMLGWAALALGTAVFLRAFEHLPTNAHAAQRLGKALGLALFLVGAAQIAGVLAGETSPRYPLRWLGGEKVRAEAAAPAFQAIGSVAELDAALVTARASGRPVLVDFYADWCVACKELEAYTFTDPAVAAAMRGFTLLRADVTANTAAHQALLRRFGLFGPPGIVLYDRSGQEAGRIIGFTEAPAFLEALRPAAA